MEDLTLFRGRRVLITGHTGFQGAWLCTWLHRLGAEVVGYALEPPTVPSLFETLKLRDTIAHHLADIRDATRLHEVVHLHQPEMIFHLAGRSSPNPAQPRQDSLETNFNGALNVLEATLDVASVRVLVQVSSDQTYVKRTDAESYRESDPMVGVDSVATTAACSDVLAAAYRSQTVLSGDRPLGIAKVRTGNIIGGGDWAEARLLPDALRAFLADESIELRQPQRVEPWLHVLDVVAGYLAIAARLWADPKKYSGPWNLGPRVEWACTEAELLDELVRQWGNGQWHSPVEPSDVGDDVRLSIDKAVSQLPWRPQWNLRQALQETLRWYREYYQQANALPMKVICERQIEAYQRDWRQSLGLPTPAPMATEATRPKWRTGSFWNQLDALAATSIE